jgi:hypothetical protein
MVVVEQLAPLNASIKVLVPSMLLPPAAISATSMLTDVQPTGVANVYHTSYLVPAQDPAIPELVALNNVPGVFTHVVPGVSVEGKLQSSDCANKKFDNVIKQIAKMLVRAFVGDMIFLGF